MRRMGELLEETERALPGPKSSVQGDDTIKSPTLPDLGISRNASSLSQKIAAVPEVEFEAHLDELPRFRMVEGISLYNI